MRKKTTTTTDGDYGDDDDDYSPLGFWMGKNNIIIIDYSFLIINHISKCSRRRQQSKAHLIVITENAVNVVVGDFFWTLEKRLSEEILLHWQKP